MKTKPSEEAKIFSQLENLCTSPGYLHAIAYFCFRDNTVGYEGQMEVESLLEKYSPEHLSRSEISMLVGLACKGDLDLNLPHPEITQNYIDETERLLEELHMSILQPTVDLLGKTISFQNEKVSNPFTSGTAFREPIFYGGEAAYIFQYRDFALEKYKNDDDWFLTKKGYSIHQAIKIVNAISKLQNIKLNSFPPTIASICPEKWTSLPIFTFTVDEIAIESNEDQEAVKLFIRSFVCPTRIDKNQFTSLNDFNPLKAYPIIQISESVYLLFQNYSLVEALYETPFFWLIEDNSYKDTALNNRGHFTERLSKGNLIRVFGNDHVFSNIRIKHNNTIIGEIDVLAIFADRAIIVQSKSKKLTIEARKGNDNSLKNDFKNAVQDAYDQALLCATYLNNEDYILVDDTGNKLNIPREYKEIYPFCVVSEHYPSLSLQVYEFLKYQETNSIMPPFVMDVFFLDVLCEILRSPLYFLSYVNRRVKYRQKVISTHELTILAYHLTNNLWITDDTLSLIIDDNFGANVDLAMLTRRDNVPGKQIPRGILTKYQSTFFGHLISQIDQLDDPRMVDLGFLLLQLSGETIEKLNKGASKIIKLSKRDGKHHDFTIGISSGSTGLTIHCVNGLTSKSIDALENHCILRKYKEKAKKWFGLCITRNSQILYSLNFDFDWIQSEEMDKKISSLYK